MGYHLTVVRTTGRERVPLAEEEVRTLLTRDPRYSFEDRGAYSSIRRTSDSGGDLYLIYKDGELWAKNPSEEHIEALVQIANELGARVRGDGYETYADSSTTFIHPDDEWLIENERGASEAIKRKRNRNRLIINGSIFLLFGLMALLVSMFTNG